MKNQHYFLIILCFGLMMLSCEPGQNQGENSEEEVPAEPQTGLEVSKQPYGQTPDGPADLYILKNRGGTVVEITNYGGIIVSIKTSDKTGIAGDIVLGFDDLSGYVGPHPHFGALIGRYGNRIADAKFAIDGKTYPLAANNGKNHLHGGTKGFGKVLLTGSTIEESDAVGVRMTYLSKDMEEGYPGNLNITVDYRLNDDNELRIDYSGTTDKPTVVNLTNHSYFNLAGEGNGDVLGHMMRINAEAYTPVDESLIPTGEIASVEGTPFDFRKSRKIGAHIESAHSQIQIGGGYDHNFVLTKAGGSSPELAAAVYEPTSGRILEVYTTEPGVQFYSGNFLKGELKGKGGKAYEKRFGFCLETQHYPDSPNQPDFPTTLVKPGETYRTTTIFKFGLAGS